MEHHQSSLQGSSKPPLNQIEFKEMSEQLSEEFKKNVCLPYFRDIYKDLASRSDNKQKGINKVVLLEYAPLPGILGDRFFKVLDLNDDGYIDVREFLTGMIRIYQSNMESQLQFVFNLYDFDGDGFISKEDIRTILQYVPIKKIVESTQKAEGKFTRDGGGNEVYLDRVQSQEELFNLLQACFQNKEKINYQEFEKINMEFSSEMLLCILMVLKDKLPCTENFKVFKQNYEKIVEGEVDKTKVQQPPRKPIAPIRIYTKPLAAQSEQPEIQQDNSPTKLLLEYATFFESKGDEELTSNIPLASFKKKQTLGQRQEIKQMIMEDPPEDSKDNLNPESVRLPNFKKASNQTQSEEDQKGNDELRSPTNYISGEVKQFDFLANGTKDITPAQPIEGEIYKKSRNNKLRRYWFSLLDKELYFFKKKDDERHKGMFNLIGVFIKDELEEIYDKRTVLHPFKLIFPQKARTFYLLKKEDKNKWMDAIKKAIGYSSLYDYYDIQEPVGKGKFGLVKGAIHKKTGKRVAVKIMKKKEMSVSDLELLNQEIEIMKICQHPNIIRLLDIFENQDFIYIVMELLKGGDLFSYLEKRNFIISEDRSRFIVHSLATGLYYLHNYSIVHRDLKPENILMCEDTDTTDVKIVDFGLSKMIGPNEICKEPYGTLSYVAPEVLIQKGYKKSVDIWSLGIILYLLLSGSLPFDDDDDREIARQTIYDDVDFTQTIWTQVSPIAKDLVEKMLIKDFRKRLTLEEILNHPWITANSGISDLRINSGEDKILEFSAYTLSSGSPRNAVDDYLKGKKGEEEKKDE